MTKGGDEVSAIVLDVGASQLKIGFAGQETPSAVLPSFLGKNHGKLVGDARINLYNQDAQIRPIFRNGESEFSFQDLHFCIGVSRNS